MIFKRAFNGYIKCKKNKAVFMLEAEVDTN